MRVMHRIEDKIGKENLSVVFTLANPEKDFIKMLQKRKPFKVKPLEED
jgi:ABC-type Zn uptake system ZnuABC Zn-binding protein ZnuA